MDVYGLVHSEVFWDVKLRPQLFILFVDSVAHSGRLVIIGVGFLLKVLLSLFKGRRLKNVGDLFHMAIRLLLEVDLLNLVIHILVAISGHIVIMLRILCLRFLCEGG